MTETLTRMLFLAKGHEVALRVLERIAWDPAKDTDALFDFLERHALRGRQIARVVDVVLSNCQITQDVIMSAATDVIDSLHRHNGDLRLLSGGGLRSLFEV
tara:strand:- start:90 stop:392 length:303 start_codon:yes stop_codon:yes gene_type:complete